MTGYQAHRFTPSAKLISVRARDVIPFVKQLAAWRARGRSGTSAGCRPRRKPPGVTVAVVKAGPVSDVRGCMKPIGDLNLLVALHVLLEERNVTRAGALIGMGQPAMSGALARLRRHYNDELLVRNGPGYDLTPLARQLVPLARDAVELAERTLALNTDFRPDTSDRRFTVTVTEYASAMLIDRLIKMIHGCGEVSIDVDVLPEGEDITALRLQLLSRDLLVLPAGLRLNGHAQRLYSDEYVCVVDPGNEVVDGEKVSVDALLELRHVVCRSDLSLLTPAHRRLAELGVDWQHALKVPWAHMVPRVVAGTKLVAIMPRRLAEVYGRRAGTVVAALPFETELIEVMHWHSAHHSDAGHQWLRSLVRRRATELAQTQIQRSNGHTPVREFA
jgi:DNA-binding transcriptional LysR family regulator